MAVITTKELGSINDSLTHEQNLISKFENYAETTTDSALKQKYEAAAEKHRQHFSTLYSLLK